MPTILFIYGWRLFFYSNEFNEPIHVHVQKGEIQAKFWLKIEEIEIKEAFSYNFTPATKREIKKIAKANDKTKFLTKYLVPF